MKGLAEAILKRIQVKEVEDYLKTYSSARMDIHWLTISPNVEVFFDLPNIDVLDGGYLDLTLSSPMMNFFGLIQRISLTGFPAQSVGSSNTYVLDSPCLLLLITGTSQSRQHGKSESDSYYLSD
ncbi:hypothetical protein Tco_1099428 [Tanacetum coccineum]